MKIVHIIWALSVGGSESMLVDIVNEQSKTEKVHLIIVNNIISESLLKNINKRVHIHKIGRTPGSRNILYPLWLNIMLLLIKPDVIHSHNHDLIKMIVIKQIVKSKFYLTVHNTKSPEVNFGKYDQIFAISESVKKYIYDRSKIEARTVFNGVSIDSIKQKKDFEFNKFKIIQVGRLDNDLKGQHILLKAVYELVVKRNVKNISVDFIGDGISKDFLVNLASSLTIETFCNFQSSREREYIYNNLSTYNLLVQPSLYEGFGLTVAEGIAAKLPVLVSDIEGPMEIIKKGEYGFFFKSGDSKDCADKIVEIMNDYGSKEFMDKATNGYNYINRMFNIRNTAREYIRYYITI